MIYHSHAGDPRMVLGAPDPTDARDAIMLVEEGANFDRKLLVYAPEAWRPILLMLKAMKEERGKLPTIEPGTRPRSSWGGTADTSSED